MTRLALHLFLCLTFPVPFLAAQTNPDSSIRVASAYFPLHKGDTWRYAKPGGDMLTVSVTDTVTRDGTKYAEITESGFVRGAPTILKKYFMRHGKFGGHVLKLVLPCAVKKPKLPAERGLCALAGTDWIWFDFTIKGEEGAWQSFGNSYTSDIGVDEFRIRQLAAHDTVRTADTVFTNCRKFQIHALGQSDSDFYEWFAPGVGMVRRGWQGDGTEDYRLIEFHVSP